MKIRLTAFLAIASSNFAFVKPQQAGERRHHPKSSRNEVPLFQSDDDLAKWSQQRQENGATFSTDDTVAKWRQRRHQRQDEVVSRTKEDLWFSKKGVLENEPERVQTQGSNSISPTKRKADIGILAPQESRILQTLPECQGIDPPCQCKGSNACAGVPFNLSTIGHQTCIGDKACYSGDTKSQFGIGNNACLGEKACWHAGENGGTFLAADDTCSGFWACQWAAQNGGYFRSTNKACRGSQACDLVGLQGNFTADDSCREKGACQAAGSGSGGYFRASQGSCIGLVSCSGGGRIGSFYAMNQSCTGGGGYECNWSAQKGTFKATHGSCSGGRGPCKKAARYGDFVAEYSSCYGRYACQYTAVDSGASFKAIQNSCRGRESCDYTAHHGGSFHANTNSCVGEKACYVGGMSGHFHAYRGSCLGEDACSGGGYGQSGQFLAKKASCIGLRTCSEAGKSGGFKAQDGSCHGNMTCFRAAYEGEFLAFGMSCMGYMACMQSGYHGNFTAYKNSCRGEKACSQVGHDPGSTVIIGEESCGGKQACNGFGFNGTSTIGEKSCLGDYSCDAGDSAQGDVIIGDNSCTCKDCCRGLKAGSRIGDCQCRSLDDNCSNKGYNINKPGTCPITPSPSISVAPSTSTSPSSAPSPSPTASMVPSALPSSVPSASIGPSSQPTSPPSVSLAPSSAPSMWAKPYQNLTIIEAKSLIGLTDSNATVSIAHLVTDNGNEIQNLMFDPSTNQLQMTKATNVIDLSHLDNPPQYLSLDKNTMRLGMAGSQININLSAMNQDLSVNKTTVDISGGGGGSPGLDLSPLRVVHLQASIHKITGADTAGTERRVLTAGEARKLRRGGKKGPEIRYGGKVENGLSVFARGQLVGMTVTANSFLTTGDLVISIVDCTDVDNIKSIGLLEDVLVLRAGHGRSNSKTFATPIPVEAGVILCFEAIRFGTIESKAGKDTAASLVLRLEQ